MDFERVVPARRLPLPSTISEEARDALAKEPLPAVEYPARDDVAGWHALVRAQDAMIIAWIGDRMSALPPPERSQIGGATIFRVMPPGHDPSDRRVYLDIHGGAFIYGGGELAGMMARVAAFRVDAPVIAIDYRMPPDHPYPAALDDSLTVYRALLGQHAPGEIVVHGTSAGGNIAAALMLRARDEGLPLPAGLVLSTPGVDLTKSGDTFQTLLGIDTVLHGRDQQIVELYTAGHSLTHPYVSPLFGDFTRGFPPTFLQSGTRDLLLSSTVLMHRALRRAGIPADLHIFEAMPHGGFGNAPEDWELAAEIKKFADRCWAAGAEG